MADPKTELLEAKQAAERALDTLHLAQKELKSAKGWGLFDILGGGLIASLAKRSRMQAMQNTMEELDAQLANLSEELKDVEMNTPDRPSDSFSIQLFDIAFDNFFTDLYVQGQLNETGRQLARLEQTLLQITDELDTALRNW